MASSYSHEWCIIRKAIKRNHLRRKTHEMVRRKKRHHAPKIKSNPPEPTSHSSQKKLFAKHGGECLQSLAPPTHEITR